MAREPDELAHTLLPLSLASELVYARVYEGRVRTHSKEELLDSIASTIAAVATVYEYEARASTVTRKLTNDDLNGGTFRGGGKELVFANGRPARTSLAVSANDIGVVIERLRSVAS